MKWWESLLRRKEQETRLDKGLSFHIEQRVLDLRRSGLNEEEAQRRVRLEFGGMDQVKEDCRDARGARWIERFGCDARYAVRVLSRRRGFAATAILATAVGIATITVVFSIVHAVLLKSLPIDHIDRVVMLWQQDLGSGRDRISLSPAEFREYSTGPASFDSIAAIRGVSLNTTLGYQPVAVDGIEVTTNIFETLGIRLARGRAFGPAARGEAVISSEFWQKTLGGGEDVLGRVLTLRSGFAAGSSAEPLDGDYVVIGILPNNLKLPYRDAGIWIPLALHSQDPAAAGGLLTFGRLRPDVTLAQASSEVAATARHLQQLSPTRSKNLTTWLVPLRQEDIGDITPSLILLAVAAALSALIVCADVANMLLSTLLEREHELETRRALGATRGALLRQLLTEGTILALAGAGAGVLLAIWIVGVIARMAPASIPRLNSARVDGWALGVAVVAALAMAAAFSIAPALRSASGRRLTLRQGNTARGGRLREVLIVTEFALASVVLSGAGLVLASARAMEPAVIGYQPSRELTFRVALRQSKYALPQSRQQFFTSVLEHLRALPGVTAAGAVSILPQMDTNRNVELQVDAAGATRFERSSVRFRVATPGYFSSLGIRVLAGFAMPILPQGRLL
jgi:putative ABC transport system permease protein